MCPAGAAKARHGEFPEPEDPPSAASRLCHRRPPVMELRAELLKSIWYAFTALDAEKSGKVSKSQLKVRRAGGKRRLGPKEGGDAWALLRAPA